MPSSLLPSWKLCSMGQREVVARAISSKGTSGGALLSQYWWVPSASRGAREAGTPPGAGRGSRSPAGGDVRHYGALGVFGQGDAAPRCLRVSGHLGHGAGRRGNPHLAGGTSPAAVRWYPHLTAFGEDQGVRRHPGEVPVSLGGDGIAEGGIAPEAASQARKRAGKRPLARISRRSSSAISAMFWNVRSSGTPHF